jgi:hypothetical protein
MDTKGNVISITGFDAVYTKVANAVGSLIKDKPERKRCCKS